MAKTNGLVREDPIAQLKWFPVVHVLILDNPDKIGRHDIY